MAWLTCNTKFCAQIVMAVILNGFLVVLCASWRYIIKICKIRSIIKKSEAFTDSIHISNYKTMWKNTDGIVFLVKTKNNLVQHDLWIYFDINIKSNNSLIVSSKLTRKLKHYEYCVQKGLQAITSFVFILVYHSFNNMINIVNHIK